MNSKTFRRNHGAKPRSTSSTFISLHFNKADEDQLEISYKDEQKAKEVEDVATKSTSELAHSNLTIYIPDTKSDTDLSSESPSKEPLQSTKEESLSNSDSLVKAYWARINKKGSFGSNEGLFEESFKGKLSKTLEGLKSNKSAKAEDLGDVAQEIKHDGSDEADLGGSNTVTSDSQIKLSPAIEAAELDTECSFNNYINDKLERAKCEILDTKTEISSSFTSLSRSKKDLQKESFSSPNLRIYPEAESSEKLSSPKSEKDSDKASETTHFYNILHKSINFINFARNNVKFHILIAVFAFLFAPIPSWLSGFLVGTILSSWLVYWLYKPAKSKKKFYSLNFVLPQNVETQKLGESGILKGWMNELPSFLNYSPDRYHVSVTKSVYVRLDGSYLRFSFPQKNISKRAMFNEPRHEMQFIYQQHYDIADAVVELLPKGLTNKRLWSKKYPICLRIPNSKEAVLSNSSRADALDTSFSTKTNKRENSNKKFSPRINENNEIVIYLFSRTDRDKSLWFYRFQKASKIRVARSQSPTLTTRIMESESSLENKRTKSVDFAFLQSGSSLQMEQPFFGEDEMDDNFVEVSLSKQQKFEMYLSSLLAPLQIDHPYILFKKEKRDCNDKKSVKAASNQSNLTWLNVLIGRMCFDFLVEDVWAQLVTEKIQKKLNRIKLPFFLTELIVKDINLGSALPKIHHASDPSIDERGLWVDVDVSYNGSFHMTLETKLSLRRFKADSEEFWTSLSDVSKENENLEQPIKASAYNSDEDSMDSSSDDEAFTPEMNEDGSLKDGSLPSSAGSRGKKLLKFVDKLAQSPYFQHAAKNKYIKRAMDDISNTPLVLTVEVQWLTGTLAINIPPWPTDRLWYGFRVNPSLSITARPKLGQHAVTFTQVTEWIEKKLVSEFQKVLVMPNMDDLIIPIMQPCSDIPEA